MSNNRSKYDYDANLFMTEPPKESKRIKALFCGRERELKRALAILKKNMDTRGTRRDKKPWVIHGESRSGKSHLSSRIVCELRRSNKQIKLFVSAREGIEAKNVMRDLFEKLRFEYDNRTRNVNVESELRDNPAKIILDMTSKLVERVAFFFSEHADSIEIQVSEVESNALEAGLKFSVIPKIFEIFGRFRTGGQETVGWKATLRSPTASDLAEYCAAMIDTLARFKLLTHTFILLDDVDLLEGYQSTERNGRIQRSLLTSAVIDLHQIPRVDILLTARSWYAHAHKELCTLVDLAMMEELSQEVLIEIHHRHFDEFVGNQSLPKNFLTDEALQQVARLAEGLPGVFLKHLQTAFRQFQDEDDWELRDFGWFRQVFQKRFEHFREKCPEAARRLTMAIQNSEKTIDVSTSNPFYHTVVHDEFVFQSYYQETTYFLSPLLFELTTLAFLEPDLHIP